VFSVGSWRQERRQRQSLPGSGTVPLPGAGAGGKGPLTAPVAGDADRNSDEGVSFLWPICCAQILFFGGDFFVLGLG